MLKKIYISYNIKTIIAIKNDILKLPNKYSFCLKYKFYLFALIILQQIKNSLCSTYWKFLIGVLFSKYSMFYNSLTCLF